MQKLFSLGRYRWRERNGRHGVYGSSMEDHIASFLRTIRSLYIVL